MYNTSFIRSRHHYEPFYQFLPIFQHNSARIYSVSHPSLEDQHDAFV
jgi:hypothetical protein